MFRAERARAPEPIGSAPAMLWQLRAVPALLTLLLAGCTCCPCLPRASQSDEEFARIIHREAEQGALPGLTELRVSAAGGHVTLGGRADSPETVKQLVTAVAAIPKVCELSFYGMEFCPAPLPDEVIAAEARRAAGEAIGETLAAQLGYYCEDHFLIVYGRLPSLALREKLEAAVRTLPGVGRYHVSCEVVLPSPPRDAQVVAAVRRKFRRTFELPNLSFRASQVEVSSSNNVVHLGGRAPTYLGKLAAGAQAAQVPGVRYVVNHIQVPGVAPAQRTPNQSPNLAPNQSAPEPPRADGNGEVEQIGHAVPNDSVRPGRGLGVLVLPVHDDP